MEHSTKDEQIMVLLTRVDERTKNILSTLDTITHRVGDHDNKIGTLEQNVAESRGTAKVTGWVAGIASSIIVGAILFALGLKR